MRCTRSSWLLFPTHDFVPRVISRKIEKDLLSTRCNVTRSEGLRLIANLEPALLPITEARVIAPIFLSSAHSRSSTFRNTIIPPIFLGAQSIASESSSSRKKKLLGVFNCATFDFFFFLLCLCFSKKFFKRVESKFNLMKLMDNVRF